MNTNINYMRYIDGVNSNLSAAGFRLLTLIEVAAIIGHLMKVVEAYPEEDIGGLSLMETLVFESVKRAAELHPDIPTPTPERVTQVIHNMTMGLED